MKNDDLRRPYYSEHVFSSLQSSLVTECLGLSTVPDLGQLASIWRLEDGEVMNYGAWSYGGKRRNFLPEN